MMFKRRKSPHAGMFVCLKKDLRVQKIQYWFERRGMLRNHYFLFKELKIVICLPTEHLRVH